jgi:heme oxygenase
LDSNWSDDVIDVSDDVIDVCDAQGRWSIAPSTGGLMHRRHLLQHLGEISTGQCLDSHGQRAKELGDLRGRPVITKENHLIRLCQRS